LDGTAVIILKHVSAIRSVSLGVFLAIFIDPDSKKNDA